MIIKEFFTAADKQIHMRAGMLVLLGSLAFVILSFLLNLHPVAVAVMLSGISAGVSVEYSQRADNISAIAQGRTPVHDVSFWDAFASALACIVISVILQILAWTDILPPWPVFHLFN